MLYSGCVYTEMLLEALLEPFALLSTKCSKHSNRAFTINLNTLIEQSEIMVITN